MPVKRMFQWGNQPKEDIPPQCQLIDVFQQVGQRLLILGKPGSGKTTLLLELAEQLLIQAQDAGTKIPPFPGRLCFTHNS